jgi:ketosteroid isomerase-like protein
VAGAVDVHPFRAAWQTRDLDAWSATFAPDIVLHSPMIQAPFSGREAATELYGVLFDALGEFEITDEFAGGDSHAFFWRANVGRRRIEGADLLRVDEQGKISEVRVLIRPLANIATFAAAAGPPLAAKRGPIQGLLLRVLTLPLRAIFAAVDFVAPRLTQRRS